jgi:hypothetical protein
METSAYVLWATAKAGHNTGRLMDLTTTPHHLLSPEPTRQSLQRQRPLGGNFQRFLRVTQASSYLLCDVQRMP